MVIGRGGDASPAAIDDIPAATNGGAPGDRSKAPQRRALVLSGELGAGHKVTAAALAAVLGADGWQSETVDSMALLGHRGGAAGQACFRGLLRLPGVYDAFHFSCLRPGTSLARLADRAARRQMVPRLADALALARPDVVIAVFATGASAAAELARAGHAPTVVALCTDVTPHRMWVHEGIETYLVTCTAAAQAVRRYQPHAKVVVIPRPVRPEFLCAPSQDAARRSLGLPAGEPCVLLMSGGWGLGPIAEDAAALAAAGLHVLAVAGANPALYSRLDTLSRAFPRLRAFGFTTEIPLLMSAADLVITTSGVTCSEARAVGRELLLIDGVPGHGRENLQHELELGHAAVASTDAQSLTAAALAAVSTAQILAADDPMPGFTRGLADVLAALPVSAPS